MFPHYSQNIYYSPQTHPGYYGGPHDTMPPSTPMDVGYSQSMLPSSLLLNSPFQRPYAPPQSPMFYQSALTPSHTPPSQSPYLAQVSMNNSLDQLNLSRTVILKNLNDKLTLNELLNEIDHGPIEYCKMFSKPSPSHIKDVENFKTCYISFINSRVAVSFHLKYSKNLTAFNHLREKLKSTKHFKILLNDLNSSSNQSNSINKQDYIKLKTLNYIMELNATRAILVKVQFERTIDASRLSEEVKGKCSYYGEIEDFKVSVNESNFELRILAHFTSIDSAIKTYEYFQRGSKKDKQDLIEHICVQSSSHLSVRHVSFHKDRCDRTEIDDLQTISNPRPRKKSITTSCHSLSSLSKHDISNESVSDSNGHIKRSSNNDGSENKEYRQISKGDENVNISDFTTSSSASPILDPVNGYFVSSNPGGYVSSHMRLPPGPQVSASSYQMHSTPNNIGNRTIYLGNLHPNTTVEEIANNVRAGGLVESINFHPDKRVCFVTFVDPAVALKFFVNHQVLHQLIIHGYDVTVGWAKNHSGPVSRDIALAVTAGASRNVYIGVKLSKEKEEEKHGLPSEQELRSDFSQFGELEQINFYHNKDCGFLNFLNISDAIRLVELFEYKLVEKINKVAKDEGQFYEKYKNLKISFAKDRCGNPPRFNFRKKPPNIKKKTAKAMGGRDNKPENSPSDVSMSEEAAQIFGIISHDTGIIKDEEVEKDYQADERRETNTGTSLEEENKGGPKSDEFSSQSSKTDETLFSNSNGEEYKNTALDDSGTQNELPKAIINNEEDDSDVAEDDEDDDNEISIIIGSEDSNSIPNSSQRSPLKKFSSKLGSSDAWGAYGKTSKSTSKSSSNTSLGNFFSVQTSPQFSYGSPYFFQKQPFHKQRQGSFRGHYPPIAPHYIGGYAGSYVIPPSQTTMLPHHNSKGHALSSGSQVMAQYLAKSHHDNLYYVASILSNDIEDVEVDQLARPRKSRG